METSDSNKQDQTSETDENNQTAADKTPDQDVARDEENGFALRFTEALLKQKKRGRKPDRIPVFPHGCPWRRW